MNSEEGLRTIEDYCNDVDEEWERKEEMIKYLIEEGAMDNLNLIFSARKIPKAVIEGEYDFLKSTEEWK